MTANNIPSSPSNNNHSPGTSRGFTLVEIMVAMAVLGLLIALLANMIGNVSTAWNRSSDKMDNFTTGRALLNAIDRDLKNAVIRQDLPAFLPATGGATTRSSPFAFYAQQYGQKTESDFMRPLTYVSYELDLQKGTLKRQDRPLDFVPDQAPQWSPFVTGSTPGDPPIDRKLSENVYAFAWRFLQADGTVSDTFKGPNTFDSTTGNPISADQRTRAVQVSLAIVSGHAQKVLQVLEREDALRNELSRAVPTGSSPNLDDLSVKAKWDKNLEKNTLDLPPPVLSVIRTYERIIPLQDNALSVNSPSGTSLP